MVYNIHTAFAAVKCLGVWQGNIGMIRVAAASPVLKVGNPEFNSGEILSCAEKAYAQGAGIIVFPELCLTGASCGDLFFQDVLYKSQKDALNEIALATKKMNAALILGTYLRIDNFLAECAILLQNGLIKGIVPKYSSGGVDGQRSRPVFLRSKSKG